MAQEVVTPLVQFVKETTKGWPEEDIQRISLPKKNDDKNVKNGPCATPDWDHASVIEFNDLNLQSQEKLWKRFLTTQLVMVKKERMTIELEEEKKSLDKKITGLLLEQTSGASKTSMQIAQHALQGFEERLQHVEGVYFIIITILINF